MAYADEKSPFYEVSEELVEMFKEVLESKSIPMDLKMKFQGNSKLKEFIKLKKISDEYAHLLEADILVQFNEDYFYKLDEQAQRILIEEEMDKIVVNLDSGKIKLLKHDFTTFKSMIEKHGAKEVLRAKGLEVLVKEQKEDQEKELAEA